jgi:hypothetical protein
MAGSPCPASPVWAFALKGRPVAVTVQGRAAVVGGMLFKPGFLLWPFYLLRKSAYSAQLADESSYLFSSSLSNYEINQK